MTGMILPLIPSWLEFDRKRAEKQLPQGKEFEFEAEEDEDQPR